MSKQTLKKRRLPAAHPANFSPIEMTLRDADRILGLNITLHDLSGVFNVCDGGTLLDPSRQSHRRFTVCRIDFCEACLRHCRDQIRLRCLCERQPFVNHCWKGVTEIVVPLIKDDVLLAILFAGTWKGEEPASGTVLPAQWRAAYDQLPPLDAAHAESLGRLLQTLGTGLVQRIEQAVLADISDTRQVQIMRFLHYHIHRKIAVADLAAAIHLSPSRTSHLVTELFGASFQELVIRQRMQRAMHFLRATDLPVAAVGRRVGIDNEYYFNRLFKRMYGQPPARYRRQFKLGTLISA